MLVLFFVVFVTILISAQCSLYEATLYSTRIGTLEAVPGGGRKKALARKMIQMKRAIGVPLSAILILNTIANTAGATIAGMYAHQVLGTGWVPAFSIAFTLAILFLAEIMPKTLGAVHWRVLWPFVVWPLTAMRYMLYPVIVITQRFTESLTRGQAVGRITEEDILGTVRLGAKEGEISKLESLMVHNIIELENKQVRDVMTPRTVMFALDSSTTVEDAYRQAEERGLTRIPVFEKDKDNIVGYVTIHDLGSASSMSRPDAPIASLAKAIHFVSESANCLILLNTLLRRRRQVCIVQDEYGGVAGLVTLEDLVETILGSEIVDERDHVVDLQEHARKQRRRRSRT